MTLRSPAPDEDPLHRLLLAAAAGDPPPSDGGVTFLAPPRGRTDAVVAFTAHHVVAGSVDETAARARLDPDDLAAPMSPAFLSWLGETLGAPPGTLDVVLAAPALGPGGSLDDGVAVRPVPVDPSHPRVARAARYRDQLRAWTTWDGDGVLLIGRGLAGRWEVAFEVAPAARGRGIGRGLAATARRLVPAGATLFAQVAPGNVPSLRAVLAAGFRPIGAEVLFLRRSSG